MQNAASDLGLHCLLMVNIIKATPCKNVPLGTCRQQRSRSACTSVQSDHGLYFPLIESLDTTECMNEEQKPRIYFAHAQDDLNLHICT